MRDVSIDFATALARGELAHGLGPRFMRLELARLGEPVDCAIGDDEDCAPRPRSAPDAMLPFGAAVVRMRAALEGLDEGRFLALSLVVVGESPWGSCDEALRRLLEDPPSEGGGASP